MKNQPGFDKEGRKLFDPNEIAKKNYIAQRLRAKENATPDSLYQSERNISSNSLDELEDKAKMPRTIETVVCH